MAGEPVMSRVLRFAAAAAAVFVVAGLTPDRARAGIVVNVNKASQSMSVIVDGEHRYTWAVSTGGYGTPSGTFPPPSLSRHHRSTLDGAPPVPRAVFHAGNEAL